MHNKLRSPKSLIAVFTVFACAVLFVFALVIFQQTKKNENYDAWVIHTYEVLRIAGRVTNNISEIEASHRGYFLTGSDSFLVPVSMQQNGVDADIHRLEQMTSDDPDKQIMTQELHELFKRYINLKDIQRKVFIEQGAKGLLIADIQHSQNVMNELKLKLEEFISNEVNDLTNRLDMRKAEQLYHVSTIVTGATIALIGLVIATVVIIFLLSSRAKTARRLQDIENLYRVILESTHDGVYDYNPVIDKAVFSDTYASQLGYGENEMPDKLANHIEEMLHPDDRERVVDYLQQYTERKIPQYTIDYRLRHHDGYWVWILDRAVGTWNKAGEMIRLVGIHTDITAQKKQEEALRELNAELESFTYIASHDLRSPLVNLKGFATEIDNAVTEIQAMYPQISAEADMLSRLDHLVNKDMPEALSFIHSSVERMNSLTTAILNLSRIGRRVYKPVEIDMNELIRRCLDNLQYETSINNIRMTVDKVPPLYADMLAMEQIFSNLLDNAVKYLVQDKKGEIQISSLEAQNEIIYIIQDNGRGIQTKDKERIFDIFQRARNSGDVRGAGMGLAFVKASVRKMGGQIWFESELDQGTTFYIALPRWKGKDDAA